MPFVPTGLEGLLVFEPRVFEDARGYFFEAYNQSVFNQAGVHDRFIQDNQSYSTYGVIRGLHYQLQPHAQCKLVRVLEGTILDVAVDMRKNAATYGTVFTIELSTANKKQLLIPHGFAHGFSVLSQAATVLYKCDALYNKESEGGVIYNDPDLAIDWKIPEKDVIISDKDLLLPSFKNAINNF
ncbi:dTDP-4-dehydrorhamnose 3,5-epimerase [Niabella ginsenosidivorans]|uniref:dTDP-4-dehydrorhamnose 3,5-epimerase n=1 Tax=Niabella ginsenosidivorans TaxID=1176587 RepID=A0A1A9I4B6_9BACT|nr:dTDP-4-dehydrorhamnose 3,5-epimerase [Niabella ginsenosidivorans]ANH81532.1 dTDP-4-dehydrorhamnose 3,5-epimerase [Niabella ginsenosidivorans]